jgi:hypothetical protein
LSLSDLFNLYPFLALGLEYSYPLVEDTNFEEDFAEVILLEKLSGD